MPLTYAHAHLSKSSSFGSSLGLKDLDSTRREFRKANDEKTPLVAPNAAEDRPGINLTLLTTILVVTIGSSFQFGFGTGVMNNSEPFIRAYFAHQGKEYRIMQWGVTVSMYGIGGLIGAIIGPKVIGRFCGRKSTLLVNNLFVFLSSCLIAFGAHWWVLALGRIFVGVTAGVATAVVPTYFSEISPIEVRGAVGTMHQLGITVGILVAQGLSTPSLHLMGSERRWQWLFLIPVLAGTMEVLVLPFMPESPSYLLKRVGKDAARASLSRLQSPEVVDRYIGYIEQEIAQEKEGNGESIGVPGLLREVSLRKQLIVGITVQLMMQFSGIDAVFYYSTTVFYRAEVPDPELATTTLGIINVVVTIFAVRFMDTAGRKTLLIYSWIGMCTSYIVLTVAFVFQVHTQGGVVTYLHSGIALEHFEPYLASMNTVAVCAMTGVIIFFAFGPGCIAWFIIAEIFPLYARDTAMAIGITINWIANFLVAFTFPLLLDAFQPWTFLVFVVTTGYFLFFTVAFVPETKGKTVAEVTEDFQCIMLPMCT